MVEDVWMGLTVWQGRADDRSRGEERDTSVLLCLSCRLGIVDYDS